MAGIRNIFHNVFATDRQTGNDGVDIIIQLAIGFTVVLAGAFFAAVIVNAADIVQNLFGGGDDGGVMDGV